MGMETDQPTGRALDGALPIYHTYLFGSEESAFPQTRMPLIEENVKAISA